MYLERFTLPDAEQEEELIMERICETRDCAGFVDNPYPCRLFPARGLRELYFQKTTILYGGNGSGKSTLLNLIAEKLKLNRIAPFNSGEMVKAYVDACRYEMAYDDEGFRHTVPDGSRIITSDDVFDYMLTVRTNNDEIGECREEARDQWGTLRYGNTVKFRGMEDYDTVRIQLLARSRSVSRKQFIRRVAGEEVKLNSNGETALRYFDDRLKNDRLYCLDEPENSLSAKRQQEQVDAIRDALEQEPLRWKMLVHLFLITGARRGELLGLKWGCVDFEQSRIHICNNVLYTPDRGLYEDTPKTEKSKRYIVLPAETMDLFRQYISTVIVKDMSRLGREYLQVGYYTEQYFPEHNIRFIAVNDGVDTTTGVDESTELAPFRNVMNEFYARDISRKVRSAHATRGKAGEPLCQPPYGYMKDPQNRKRWIIDPDAAPIVKEIFKLYIDGNGIDTIARIMQEEGHLNCTSYWASKGINRGGKKEQPNPYKWKSTSVYNILKRQEYCGDVLNFKTHSKSFKNHRRIDNPKEDWLIFEDVHDPIIDRNTYNKVQKMLANTKHRAPKEENGPKSIFCDLLYCADCHKKMWYHTNTVNKDIHYFSCSNYVKDYRGTCLTRHYIRADSIATIVEMELRRLADYLVDDTERFAEILAKKSTKEWESEKKAAQGELTKAEMRIEMIPKLLKKLYEDNLSGKTSDDDYSILSQEYSVERDQLKKKILGLRDKLKGMEDRAGEREAFVKAIRKFMSMKTLTAPLLRELIDHIDVYEVEGQGKNKTQRVVIYYKFVGYLEIPNDLSRPTYSADLREGVSVEYITCEAGEDILDDEPEADKKAE